MPRFKITLDFIAKKTRVEETGHDAERHPPMGTIGGPGGQVVYVDDFRDFEEACVAAEALDEGLRYEIPRDLHLKIPIDLDLGKAAYDAYFAACGGKSLVTGAPLPTWEGSLDKIQVAWRAAATAVVRVACPAEISP